MAEEKKSLKELKQELWDYFVLTTESQQCIEDIEQLLDEMKKEQRMWLDEIRIENSLRPKATRLQDNLIHGR